jgi:hypothetical protein
MRSWSRGREVPCYSSNEENLRCLRCHMPAMKAMAAANDLFAMVLADKIRITVSKTYPLAESGAGACGPRSTPDHRLGRASGVSRAL